MVSIHARTRRATAKPIAMCRCRNMSDVFQSHARTRRATDNAAAADQVERVLPRSLGFNPRPHTTGDRQARSTRCLPNASKFQSTPAHDGRHPYRRDMSERPAISFQSTPAHDGRRRSTPARAARRQPNPRPHTTGDLGPDGLAMDCLNGPRFNPRPAHDGRRGNISRNAGPASRRAVSIHARTRRATSGRSRRRAARSISRRCFNPRPHTTGDARKNGRNCLSKARSSTFQSTPAHDGRQITGTPTTPIPLATRFNPRHAHDGRPREVAQVAR